MSGQTDQELDDMIADMKANPEKYRLEADAEARRANPHMTQEQLDASWEQVKESFGL